MGELHIVEGSDWVPCFAMFNHIATLRTCACGHKGAVYRLPLRWSRIHIRLLDHHRSAVILNSNEGCCLRHIVYGTGWSNTIRTDNAPDLN